MSVSGNGGSLCGSGGSLHWRARFLGGLKWRRLLSANNAVNNSDPKYTRSPAVIRIYDSVSPYVIRMSFCHRFGVT